MRVLLYGDKTECESIIPLLRKQPFEHQIVDDYEEFTAHLVDYSPELIVVLKNGADGMEGVYRSRQHLPDIPVFWFSDDRGFAIQAYRLKCAYFSEKPVTRDKCEKAFARLAKIGIIN